MTNTNKPGILFWIIGIVALLWNGVGVFMYLGQAFDLEMMSEGLNADQIALSESMPAWYTALFAIAVFAGILGALALLMKKKVAVILFIVSFLAATVNQIYWLFGTDAVEVFADHQPYLMPAIIVVIGLVLVWYSRDQKTKGVLS
jgi:hypothetical protein